MDYYIKIKPQLNYATYSLYSYKRFTDSEKSKIISIEYIKEDKYGTPYVHGGYVKCYYGRNELRIMVYESLPQFGHIVARFKTLKEAADFINNIEATTRED